MYGAGHKYRTLHLPISTTLAEVLDRVSGMSPSQHIIWIRKETWTGGGSVNIIPVLSFFAIYFFVFVCLFVCFPFFLEHASFKKAEAKLLTLLWNSPHKYLGKPNLTYRNLCLLNVAPLCIIQSQSQAQWCRSTQYDCALVTMKVRRVAPLLAICFSLRLAVMNGSIAPLLSRPAADRNLIRHRGGQESQCPSLFCRCRMAPPPWSLWTSILIDFFILFVQTDTPSITAKLINEQKEDKEKKNHEEKEKMKADSGFQDNYSVVVASGTSSAPHWYPTLTSSRSPAVTTSQFTHTHLAFTASDGDNFFFLGDFLTR